MNLAAVTMPAKSRVDDMLASVARDLSAAGIEGARRDAQLLLRAATALSAEALYAHPGRLLTSAQQRRLARLVERRRAREPVSRIVGRREFWGLEFAITRAVLDPRPDSEALIEAALAVLPDRGAPLRIADLGTGSGCLLLALLSELPAAHGVGCDVSEAAVRVAYANAAALGLANRAKFAVGDWAEALGGRFDIILANPPYVPAPAIAALAPEVSRFDPRPALGGGADGLAAYRALAPQLGLRLAPGGFAIVEVGDAQAAGAAALLKAHGLRMTGTGRDLAGVERCIIVSVAA